MRKYTFKIARPPYQIWLAGDTVRIIAVPDQRHAPRGHLKPNLMRTPGLQFECKQDHVSRARKGKGVRYGTFSLAFWDDNPPRRPLGIHCEIVDEMQPNSARDVILHISQSDILAVDESLAQGSVQLMVRVGVFGKQDSTRCVFV